MHPTAKENLTSFFKTYCKEEKLKVLEIGSRSYGFNKNEYLPTNVEYIGLDLVPGGNVDVVIDDPYTYPLDSNSIDIVISTSVFEHTDFFWLSVLEIMRVLKPNGLFYMNAPSNGCIHRFPRDSWRFYPDAGMSLKDWINRNGGNSIVLESYTDYQQENHITFNDFVCIFLKNKDFISEHPNRILYEKKTFFNGIIDDGKIVEGARFNGFLNWEVWTDDQINRLKLMGSWESSKDYKETCGGE